MKRRTRITALIGSLCLFSFTALTAMASEPKSQLKSELTGNLELKGKEAAACDTYTVRIFSGNQGRFTDGSTVKIISLERDRQITLREYEKLVELLEPQKYYIRGIRESGKDNSSVSPPSFAADRDMDFVVAYGVRGNMVGYTVEFVDENGSALAPALRYEGKTGEKQIVSYQYIEGYRPQAYNLAKTLDEDEKQNVFRFVYTPGTVPEGVVLGEDGEIVTMVDGGVTVLPGGAGAGGAGAEVGGTEIGDEEVPLAPPEDLIDLDEEEVPLADTGGFFSVKGNATLLGIPLPVVLAAGLFLAGGVWFILVYGKRKKQKEIEL